MWGTEDKPAILPKTKGAGIMVIDFVDEYGGFLRLTTEQHAIARQDDASFPIEARQFLEYGGEWDGYWTNQKFMEQMAKAVKISDFKFDQGTHTIVWIFDQSSCHKAFAPGCTERQQDECSSWRSTGKTPGHSLGWESPETGV